MIRTKLPLAFTGLLIFSLLSWHCTKIDTTTLGSGLIPAVDNVNTFETVLNVVANNFDSVTAGKECTTIYPTDEHALGYIGNDPYFGNTVATIYTELKPASFPFSFEAKPADRTLDSVVLVLSYKRVWGDSTLPQTVTVREISGTFNPDSSSCSSYPYNTSILGSVTYTPQRLKDTVKAYGGDTSINQLRIKLSSSFGQALLSQDSSNQLNAFKSDSLFKAFFKGFAIVPNNTGNALTYYGITDANTKLAIYYKYKRTNLADTAVVSYFRLFNGDHSANNIARTRNNSEITQNVNHPLAGDNNIYIQTSPGSFAELKIPSLDTLSNRIIHRAELIMDQVSPTALDNILTPPAFLFLDMKDSAKGAYHPVPCDFIVTGGQPDIFTYGGFKTNVTVAGSNVTRYAFNISRYVQKVITNRKANVTLRLRAPNYVINTVPYIDYCGQGISQFIIPFNKVALGRVKLAGGTAAGSAVNRMRLRIIYSKL